ncbi:hypothetical protein SISNIDRAFT_317464 [Sistotremastrum niveocremeum HHB9708]|uniref:Uncharacterized protein n=1 Tax=Sistotremastrum niveocremeum HHB9708 TaxID=1314777 RepID=A0A164Y1X2_9AGAM|nr:hypothetical protein SISNIDRAFT_317464 [Sistotremastrum niveocremeum HHB9708]
MEQSKKSQNGVRGIAPGGEKFGFTDRKSTKGTKIINIFLSVGMSLSFSPLAAIFFSKKNTWNSVKFPYNFQHKPSNAHPSNRQQRSMKETHGAARRRKRPSKPDFRSSRT